jgi:hypothetical protein
MKHILISLATLGVLILLVSPSLAYGGPYSANIVQVNGPYYGGYYSGYYAGWYGPRVYYGPVVRPYPVVRPCPGPPPIYRHPYYQHPHSGFYYYTPGLSFRIGF